MLLIKYSLWQNRSKIPSFIQVRRHQGHDLPKIGAGAVGALLQQRERQQNTPLPVARPAVGICFEHLLRPIPLPLQACEIPAGAHSQISLHINVAKRYASHFNNHAFLKASKIAFLFLC